MTPEEIEAMEQAIPEWKRNAVVLSDQATEEEKKGMLSGIKNKFGETKMAKDFKKSEEYSKLREARTNYNEFKSKLSEGVENTQSPML